MDEREESNVGYGTVAGSRGEESKQLTGCGRTDDGKGWRGEEKIYGEGLAVRYCQGKGEDPEFEQEGQEGAETGFSGVGAEVSGGRKKCGAKDDGLRGEVRRGWERIEPLFMSANKRVRFLLYKSDPYSAPQPDGRAPTPIRRAAPTGPPAPISARRATRTGIYALA